MNTGTAAKHRHKYPAPGVYLEEQFREPQRDRFQTGVPVFIGLCKSASLESVSRGRVFSLSLWSHFVHLVGKPYQDCTLAYAVRGFFQNGGSRCYVIVVPDLQPKTLMAAVDIAGKSHNIDLVCVPDLGEHRATGLDLQQLVVNHCEDSGDRFAILDSWRDDKLPAVCAQWSYIDGKNGAIYYPWLEVQGFEHSTVHIPPCGHVAGVYARTDQNRGVHKAPANEVLEGVVSLERHITNKDFEDLDSSLDASRINCLRSFPGRGIRVWGARTLSSDSAWTYVNVRRLFLTAVRWIECHMSGVVFEPNDERLWARIDSELQRYFFGLYRQGALRGRSPKEAYYVKCNAETNPREVVEAGQVIAEIGLAPANPFEFVVVRLIYGASGVTISGPTRPEQNL